MNLYGFVGNDGANRWDVLGLQWIEPLVDEPLPTEPPTQLPPDDCVGCTQEIVDAGLKQLNERYQILQQKIREAAADIAINDNPLVPSAWLPGASCKNCSNLTLVYLNPVPACWVCEREYRKRGFGNSHAVVICRGYICVDGESGKECSKVAEVMYDLWGGRPAGEDPKDFRRKYPIPSRATWEIPVPELPVPQIPGRPLDPAFQKTWEGIAADLLKLFLEKFDKPENWPTSPQPDAVRT